MANVVNPDDKYEVYNLDTDESHGTFPSYEQALGAVRYDKIQHYQIWQGYVTEGEFISCQRVVSVEDHSGVDDPRVREALGLPDRSDSPALDRPWWENR